jgi:CRISPR/Cas system-associated exonuclease Cas4 (RecB family)
VDRIEDAEDSEEYWSYSKLQTIQLCGYKYWLKYRNRVEEKKTVALLFGSDIHRCIDKMHKESIWGEGEVQRLWSDVWLNTARHIDWSQEVMGQALYKNRGLKMLEQYRDNHKNDLVVASEIRFKIPATETTAPVQGTIDKIIETEDGLAVIDFKTSKNPPDPFVLRRDYQLSIYYLAAKELKYPTNKLAIHHLLTGDVLWSERNDEDIEKLQIAIADAKSKVANKLFARNIDWHCKFCSYKEVCLG